MRIKIVQGAENNETTMVAQTAEMLRKEIAATHQLIEENPDVIHILGGWNKESIYIAKQAKKRHIAYVYTPLTAIAPWSKINSSNKSLAADSTAIVASGDMERLFIKSAINIDAPVVNNPIITSATTPKAIAEAYNYIYATAYKTNEQALIATVKEKVAEQKEEDSTIV